MLKIEFTASAEKEFLKLPKAIQVAIQKKIIALADGSLKAGIKKLTSRDEYRLRIGDYRVLFEIEQQKVLVISKIGHRRDVYD